MNNWLCLQSIMAKLGASFWKHYKLDLVLTIVKMIRIKKKFAFNHIEKKFIKFDI